MKAVVTRVTPLYPIENFVQWTVEDPENTVTKFRVLRSQSPSGEFSDVSGILTDATFYFRDTKVHHLGLTTKVWYQVKVIPSSGEVNAVLSESKTVEFVEDPIRGRLARKARYDLGITLSRFSGSEIKILKRKRFGPRCYNCYNDVTKDVLQSHCSICYGTSFEGGYHLPIQAWGKLDPSVVQAGFDRTGDTELSVFGLTMLDYPEVESGDVIVENRTNRRFMVKRKVPTEGSRVLVHQDLQISELSRAATEYTIPVVL